MGRIRLRRPSPAMVMATLALIVALGGTAFAGPVAQLARLVSGDQLIKKHSLSGNRLRNHTLTGTQINLSTLGTVPSASHANSATNATNASQLAGVPASSYLSGYQLVVGTSSPDDATQQKVVPISCPAGTKLIELAVADITLVGTLPSTFPSFINDTSGKIYAQKYDGQNYSVTPEAVCAKG